MSKIKHLYLDMDGLLIDFTQGCVDLFGTPFDENNASGCWKHISKNESFWIDLKPVHGAVEFVEAVTTLGLHHGFDVRILSGTPSSKTVECEIQKMTCVKTHFPTFHASRVHLCKSKSKQIYACKHSVLVDDRAENIKRWTEAGGIGIYHKECDNFIATLGTIMELLQE